MPPYPSSASPLYPEHPPLVEASTGARVLVVAPQPFYSDRGTPITTRYMIKALDELGYGVDVLTYPFGAALDVEGVGMTRIPNPLRVQGVPIGFSWRKAWLDLFLLPAIADRLQGGSYDCVSALEESAFAAAVVAPRFGVPVLYDMQSSLAEQMSYRAPFRNPIGRGFLNRCERWLLDNVDLIMTSVGLADRVRAASPTARVHEWRYPGLIGPAEPADVERLRTELYLPEAAPVVLYAGSCAEYQGLPDLVAAMPAVLEREPDAVLVLVGAEDEAERRRMLDLTASLGDGSVRVVGRQAKDAVPPYLGLADVLVSPRRYGENLPLKVLDYLASGRAIVATDIPAHRTVLDADRAMLVSSDPRTLGEAVTTLLSDPELRRGVGTRARQFAEENLGWVAYVSSVGEAFGQLCGNGAAR